MVAGNREVPLNLTARAGLGHGLPFRESALADLASASCSDLAGGIHGAVGTLIASRRVGLPEEPTMAKRQARLAFYNRFSARG